MGLSCATIGVRWHMARRRAEVVDLDQIVKEVRLVDVMVADEIAGGKDQRSRLDCFRDWSYSWKDLAGWCHRMQM